ncbi:MAG: hypothetical protein U0325_11020 [Polyangiales bacterium]
MTKPAARASTAARLNHSARASAGTPSAASARSRPPLATDNGPDDEPSPRTSRALPAASRVSNTRVGVRSVRRLGGVSARTLGRAAPGTATDMGGSVTTGGRPHCGAGPLPVAKTARWFRTVRSPVLSEGRFTRPTPLRQSVEEPPPSRPMASWAPSSVKRSMSSSQVIPALALLRPSATTR